MAMVEIDESQLLGMTQTAHTVRTMLAHPDAKNLVLRAQKLAQPNVSIPELDIADATKSEIAKFREELAAERQARAEEKAAAAADAKIQHFAKGWDDGKRRLKAEQGYTDEGIAAIEKLAQDEGIANLDAAAALFDRRNPPAEPISGPGFNGWNMFEQGSTETGYVSKLLASKGEDAVATRNEVAAALADMRGGRR